MDIFTWIGLGIAAIIAACLVVVLHRSKRLMDFDTEEATDSSLPSISVCIPARNEAHALSTCLDRILASNYEKLEVLVLDDESEDATPTLIKSFAHAGVRFIAGKPLPSGWIGKNHALDTLAREASGDYIIFADVDIHIETDTISKIARVLSQKQPRLLSFIPQRADTLRPSALLGYMRYMWDMVNIGSGGLSASASAWCVQRTWLLESTSAGFESLRHVIRPELSIAALAGAEQMIVLGSSFGIAYEKRWHSQMESSERLLLPTLRAYGWKSSLLAITLYSASVSFLILLTMVFVQANSVAIVQLGVLYLIGYIVHFTYLSMAWRTRAWLGALLWPWTILQESCSVLISIIKHMTRTLTWKGRRLDAQPVNDDYYTI
jgi:glycosyltransferase involved in cell wall biosynthesis